MLGSGLVLVSTSLASCSSDSSDSAPEGAGTVEVVQDASEVECGDIIALDYSIDAFLNDALDGTPGEMPGPDEMRARLDAMRSTAERVASAEDDDLADAAQSVVGASDDFATFMDGYGYDLREFDYAGDTPISEDLNIIIDTMDLETIDAAVGSC